jgi:hypothetical protein
VAAAATLGMAALNFTDAERLRADLVGLGLLAAPQPISEPVFHVAERSVWVEAEVSGRYPWSSRDLGYEREGFVHCSFADQVPGIVMNHYADLHPSCWKWTATGCRSWSRISATARIRTASPSSRRPRCCGRTTCL